MFCCICEMDKNDIFVKKAIKSTLDSMCIFNRYSNHKSHCITSALHFTLPLSEADKKSKMANNGIDKKILGKCLLCHNI